MNVDFEEIRTEVDTLAKLDHPKIIKIYSFIKGQDLAFILFEWIEGQQLRKLNCKNNERLISCVLKQIFLAVKYIHNTKGICHRDLSLDNIMYY